MSTSARAVAARERARALLPHPMPYPPELPIAERADEIITALRRHQVVIVAGETGSGKSTQLPKICLDAGRGTNGMIGHTQPRRIAARSVAERVAEELGCQVGDAVGYKIRFTDRVHDGTLVKLMTDGALLAELHGDPALRAYDTLIVDEAHERSLNIDFILGYLKRLLPQRQDLSVVITSATIDTERFSQHFSGAPVVEVEGRAYPVEIRYRPFASSQGDDAQDTGEEVDEVDAVCDAVESLCGEGPGDILVFLPGQREIGDATEALSRRGPDGLEVVPLFGRLSSAQQHRIFERHRSRRVVLATNVAETSLTVPGIRYVVDVGTARISRYSRRTKLQRLPIEPVSQASADQRAGRCGRLGPGICIRLYSEESYAARPRYSEPEVLRTNLASVLLQMAFIGLGEVEDFPFIDPPDRRNVKDGIAVLQEIGALRDDISAGGGGNKELTAIGRKLAQLPLDPRYGRMVLEGARRGCLEEVLVIVSGLSVQDPRERPADKSEIADTLHARFESGTSDFAGYLRLWEYVEGRQSELSTTQFRRMCRKEMLSYQRVREWQDVHAQLQEISRRLRLAPDDGKARVTAGAVNERRRSEQLHRALLSGMPTHVGARSGQRLDYAAPRNARFAIWPGSALAKARPRWVVAAELVETGRLWGRVAAPVRPQWVEEAASHLLKWSYSEPVWDPERGEAVMMADAALHGLRVVHARRLGVSHHDAALAREMFIAHGLVEAQWEAAPPFVKENLVTLQERQAFLHRARQTVPEGAEEALARFYDRSLRREIISGTTFYSWWRQSDATERALLRATAADFEDMGFPEVSPDDFPDMWPAGDGGAFAVGYCFRPGQEEDGLSIEVPLFLLGSLAAARTEWNVPGFRHELIVALLRSLPKEVRRELSPIAVRAEDFLRKYGPDDGPLGPVLAKAMTEATGFPLSEREFDWEKVPNYLRPALQVVDTSGRALARSRDPGAIAEALRPHFSRQLQLAFRRSVPGLSGVGNVATTWDFGRLPEVFETDWNAYRLRGFPALVDQGDGASLEIFPDEPSAVRAHAAGVRRLVLLNLPGRRQLVDQLERSLDNRAKLALAGLARISFGSAGQLAAGVVAAAVDEAQRDAGPLPRDETQFQHFVEKASAQLGARARAGMKAASTVIAKMASLNSGLVELRERHGDALKISLDDIAAEVAWFAGGGMVARTGLSRLPDVERYLAALERRLEKLPSSAAKDAALLQRAQRLRHEVDEAVRTARSLGRPPATIRELEDLRWAVEELRVSLWAQSLGTKFPVSEERVRRQIGNLLS